VYLRAVLVFMFIVVFEFVEKNTAGVNKHSIVLVTYGNKEIVNLE